MNSEYKRTRFIASPPPDGFPTRFGVITACNPNGHIASDEQNIAETEKLREVLIHTGKHVFAVTGCSPNLAHREPGFGVVCDASEIVELGRNWEQEAVFWVEDGVVHLVPCGPGEPAILGAWTNLLLSLPNG